MGKRKVKKNILVIGNDGRFSIPSEIRNLVNLHSFEMILDDSILILKQIKKDEKPN